MAEVSCNTSSFEVHLGSISSKQINNKETKENNKGGAMDKALDVFSFLECSNDFSSTSTDKETGLIEQLKQLKKIVKVI